MQPPWAHLTPLEAPAFDNLLFLVRLRPVTGGRQQAPAYWYHHEAIIFNTPGMRCAALREITSPNPRERKNPFRAARILEADQKEDSKSLLRGKEREW
jgi:hypothetical protein